MEKESCSYCRLPTAYRVVNKESGNKSPFCLKCWLGLRSKDAFWLESPRGEVKIP